MEQKVRKSLAEVDAGPFYVSFLVNIWNHGRMTCVVISPEIWSSLESTTEVVYLTLFLYIQRKYRRIAMHYQNEYPIALPSPVQHSSPSISEVGQIVREVRLVDGNDGDGEAGIKIDWQTWRIFALGYHVGEQMQYRWCDLLEQMGRFCLWKWKLTYTTTTPSVISLLPL